MSTPKWEYSKERGNSYFNDYVKNALREQNILCLDRAVKRGRGGDLVGEGAREVFEALRQLELPPGISALPRLIEQDRLVLLEFLSADEARAGYTWLAGIGGRFASVRWLESKLDFFFSHLSRLDRSRMQLDQEAVYSVSEPRLAGEITAIAQARNPGEPPFTTVLDACACVGGNVLSFAEEFEHVHAVEFDETRWKMLQNNVKAGLPSRVAARVTCYHGSCVDLIRGAPGAPEVPLASVQVAFFDPPWGGVDYVKASSVDLMFGDVNMASLVVPLVAKCPALRSLIIKGPRNLNMTPYITALTTLSESGKQKRMPQLFLFTFPKILLLYFDVRTRLNPVPLRDRGAQKAPTNRKVAFTVQRFSRSLQAFGDI
jgi:predicted RNA methylase